jgi:hypothetical protein
VLKRDGREGHDYIERFLYIELAGKYSGRGLRQSKSRVYDRLQQGFWVLHIGLSCLPVQNFG